MTKPAEMLLLHSSTFRQMECDPSLVTEVVKQLEGHPLSIRLFALRFNQACQSLRALLSEWKKVRTQILKQTQNGDVTLCTSIIVSLQSPSLNDRSHRCQFALGLLCLVSDGLCQAHLNQLVNDEKDELEVLDRLLQAGLVEESVGLKTRRPRLRVLAPIRDFIISTLETSHGHGHGQIRRLKSFIRMRFKFQSWDLGNFQTFPDQQKCSTSYSDIRSLLLMRS
ncbi:hypothetical protein BT69DRAFT_453642 [Atractiella rhizophila]|nr:hypothetical protein BT69DRAFT_453642 [Atractiella rhizophila]